MNGFVRTFLMMLGALALFLMVMIVTIVLLLRGQDTLPDALREQVLSPEERSLLRRWRERPPEPPPVPVRLRSDYDEALSRIAQEMSVKEITELTERLRQREHALDERARELDRLESQLRLARADLATLENRLAERRREAEQILARQRDQHERWARAQLDEARRIQVIEEVERANFAELAATYQQRPETGWSMLRNLDDPREMAAIISFMEPKRAARILDLAVNDRTLPDVALRLHRAMASLDREGLTGSQAERLANLYQFLPAETVLDYLAGSRPDEFARILVAMEIRRRVPLMELLQQRDPARFSAVQRELPVQMREGEGQ